MLFKSQNNIDDIKKMYRLYQIVLPQERTTDTASVRNVRTFLR